MQRLGQQKHKFKNVLYNKVRFRVFFNLKALFFMFTRKIFCCN